MKVPTDYNVIVIMPNSFRQDHISFYNRRKPVFDGMEPCKTPNIDKFAEERMNLIDEPLRRPRGCLHSSASTTEEQV